MHSRICAGLITAGALSLAGCATPASQADESTATPTAAQGSAASDADHDDWDRQAGHPNHGVEPVTFTSVAQVWEGLSEAERKARAKAERAAREKALREEFLASFTEVDTRTIATIIRDPDGHSGERIIVYGEVTQYDSATGLALMRADVASDDTTSYGWFDGDSAILRGSATLFDDLIEGDVFRARLTVERSLSSDTEIGGSTAVPLFTVQTITRIGSNG